MTRHHIAAAAILAVLIGLSIAGCGGVDTADRQRAPAPEPTAIRTTPESQRPTADADMEETMKIQIVIGGQQFHATLNNSAASRDLIAQLPQSIDMRDHGGVEKTGRLRLPLSLDDQPSGADPDVGDVGYYAPGHDFVLYYGDQSYYEGIVILGHLDGVAPAAIAQMDGGVTARVEKLTL